MRAAVLATAMGLVLAACAAAPEEQPANTSKPGATATAEPIDYKACIVSDAGGFDDKSFNQLSYEGTKRAAEELGAGFAEVQSDSETDFQGNIEAMVAEDCNTIVTVGFAPVSYTHLTLPTILRV